MIEIALTSGDIALVDDEDEWVRAFNWYLNSPGGRKRYAKRSVYADGKVHNVSMHRAIMGLTWGDPEHVDHINGDGLDNRRANLRLATRSQNAVNAPHAGGSSQYRGVSWVRRDGVWQVYIRGGGRNHFVGWFHDEVEAARAYDRFARELHGEFARLNFPDEVAA